MAEDALSFRVLEAVAELLTRITPGNGFRTDIGDRVDVEDAFPTEASEARANVLTEGFDLDDERTTQRQRARTLLGAVEVYVPLGAGGARAAGLLAHNAMNDVLDALPNSATLLPDNSTTLTITGQDILRRPEGLAFVVAQVTFQCLLSERIPFPKR